jgi:hypothetical protein
MSHDDILLLDSSLVIGYVGSSIVGGKDCADDHMKLGKKFYLVKETINGLSAKNCILPTRFEATSHRETSIEYVKKSSMRSAFKRSESRVET